MTGQTRNCRCDGSNENCAYCYGTGVVEVKLHDNSRVAVYVTGAPKRMSIAEELGIYTQLRSSKSRRFNGVKDLTSQLPQRSRKSKVVKSTSRAISVPDKPNGPNPKNVCVQCPYCPAKVKASRISSHCRKVHLKVYTVELPPFISSKKTHKHKKRPFNQTSSQNPNNQRVVTFTTQEETRRERQLDATRLYAHSYREEGRFGSHPSHDSFDDESSSD